MKSKGFVDAFHQVGWDPCNSGTHSLNGNGADLFGLSLGLAPQPGRAGRELDLPGSSGKGTSGYQRGSLSGGEGAGSGPVVAVTEPE